MFRGILQGVQGYITGCSGVYYRVFRGILQGVQGHITGCSGVYYRVFRGILQGVQGYITGCSGEHVSNSVRTLFPPPEFLGVNSVHFQKKTNFRNFVQNTADWLNQ